MTQKLKKIFSLNKKWAKEKKKMKTMCGLCEKQCKKENGEIMFHNYVSLYYVESSHR